jgi:hypothetical protein
VAAVQRMAAHLAVAVARVLALVHPQIVGKGTDTFKLWSQAGCSTLSVVDPLPLVALNRLAAMSDMSPLWGAERT